MPIDPVSPKEEPHALLAHLAGHQPPFRAWGHSRMKRVRAFVLLATICVSVATASSSGAQSQSPLGDANTRTATASVTWQDIATALPWAVLRPTVNLGLHLKQLDIKDQCSSPGDDYQGYTASYGTQPARAIDLFVAKGFICGDAEESAVVAHILIHGRRIAVHVPYTDRTPTLADGYRYRIWLYWKQGGTVIYLQGSHLHLAELARVARSLTPIRA